MKVPQKMLRRVRGAQRVFDLFEASVREWRDKLGLDDWRVIVQQTDESELASCIADTAYKIATISVNPKRVLGDKYNALQIESTAVHELVHAIVWLQFNELANPAVPASVLTLHEERTTEKIASSLMRAKYNNDPAVQALWKDYVVLP